jgi:RNA polymerase sigma-70 factor (ECF subfamily)
MDGAAIQEIYEKYGFLIYRRCLNILHDDAEAKDAMQEVFLKLIKNYGKIRNTESIVPWIYNTAKNHCFNICRYRKKFVAHIDWETVKDTDNFEERLSARQILSLVFKGQNQKIRDAVYYTYIEKSGQAEIHKLTGQSPATVRRNLKRFRESVEKIRRRTGL